MDHDSHEGAGENGFDEERQDKQQPRDLPSDLPRSLNDRRSFTPYAEETEMYDAWQGRKAMRQSATLMLTGLPRPITVPYSAHDSPPLQLQSLSS